MVDGVLPAMDSNHPLYSQRNALYPSDRGKSKRTSDEAENVAMRSNKKATLRRGKWTTEEEAYANHLIHEFKQGVLPLMDGTTLRTFLSKLLHCDPMRISKKYVGHNCIGKQVFRRRQQDLERLAEDDMERSRKELAELERSFLERVAQTNRTKSAAPKTGKYGYGGDDHGGALAPWLIPPDDSEQVYSSKTSGHSWTESATSGELVFRAATSTVCTPFSSIDSINRISSLEALCSMDAKTSSESPHGFDFIHSLYGPGDSCFPWPSDAQHPAVLQAPPREAAKIELLGPIRKNNSLDNLAIAANVHPTVSNDVTDAAKDAAKAPFGGPGGEARLDGSKAPAVPRNSSVENFWMLVSMGDIPYPDKDVLSETLWRGDGAPS